MKYSCYFVKDTIFTDEIRKDYFSRLPRLGSNWYYKIIQPSR